MNGDETARRIADSLLPPVTPRGTLAFPPGREPAATRLAELEELYVTRQETISPARIPELLSEVAFLRAFLAQPPPRTFAELLGRRGETP